MTALLARDPCSRRTGARERTGLTDQCPSGYDLALAAPAVRAGWGDDEIRALLIAHRRRHGDTLNLRADYHVRTPQRARTREGRR